MKHTPIKVVIQQPALPRYRIPVFRALAQRPDIQLHVAYAAGKDSPPNTEAEGFESHFEPMWQRSIVGVPVYWHSSQWKYAAFQGADVLILSWDLHYASLIPALLRAKKNGVATILWGHGYSKQERGWRKFLRQTVARLACALVFYNHRAAQEYLDLGWDPSRIHVALNSLDQAPIENARRYWMESPHRLAEFRREHNLEGSRMVLFVSRLDRLNRVDLLLQACFRLINGGMQDLKIVIIGDGPSRLELIDLAKSLGIESQIFFPGSVYEEHELAPWFLSANVFCYPANVGLSLLHAFGYGLPVVTGNRIESQNPEIEALDNGENGLMFEDGDEESLAAALVRVLNSRELAAKLSAGATATISDRFSLDNMVTGFESAIKYCAPDYNSNSAHD
jgi:glycosyltransferase involved in cell wall biosynthesis